MGWVYQHHSVFGTDVLLHCTVLLDPNSAILHVNLTRSISTHGAETLSSTMNRRFAVGLFCQYSPDRIDRYTSASRTVSRSKSVTTNVSCSQREIKKNRVREQKETGRDRDKERDRPRQTETDRQRGEHYMRFVGQ